MPEVLEPKIDTPTRDPKFDGFLKNLTDDKKEPEVPKQYACVLHNDRTTDAFLVVQVLVDNFALSDSKAMELMMAVHNGSRGLIGIYGKDEAETRSANAMNTVHSHGFRDFRISVEEEK